VRTPTSLHHPQIRRNSVNEFTLCEMIWDDFGEDRKNTV